LVIAQLCRLPAAIFTASVMPRIAFGTAALDATDERLAPTTLVAVTVNV
jgi:hypothetical protein